MSYSPSCTWILRVTVAVLLGLLISGTAWAEETPRLEAAEQQAFQAAVARIAPSVVRIETVGGLEQVEELNFGAGPTTGLIVSADGYLVSSAFNFVHRPDSILVQLSDGARKPAQLVATDHNRLLVLLKIEPDRPLPVPEAAPPSEVRVGQWAIAVGRTFDPQQPNVAVGIVSALRRIWGKAIQTDAAVSPDNYGGPLVDVQGRVLGLLMPMSPESGGEMAGYEWYNSGIGFAVPLSDIEAILPRLKEGRDLHSGLAGLSFSRERTDFDPAVIAALHPTGPAAKAGLRPEQRIVAVDGRPIERLGDLKRELAQHYAGDRITLSVERDGQSQQVALELAAKLEPYQTPFLGLLPVRRPRNPESPTGVAVRYVYPHSPAAEAGLAPGDVVLKVEEAAVADAAALREQLAQKAVGDTIRLEVRRGSESRSVSAKLTVLPESLPEAPLPSAWASEPAPSAERPSTGLLPLRLPELPNEASLYVPASYDPTTPAGLCVWLHGSEGLDEKALVGRWKAICERDRVLLLIPKATSGKRWEFGEFVVVGKFLAMVSHDYQLDPTRIVLAGQQTGGTVAYLAAFQKPERIHGVATLDATMVGQPPEAEPLRRLAFFLAETPKPAPAQATATAAKRLRALKHPVTEEKLGAEASDPVAAWVPNLARWLDSLDRI